MTISQLPKTIDPRKLARKGLQLKGSLALADFTRLVDALADDQGKVEVTLRFYLDECRKVIAEGYLDLRCKMICQRCLGIADIVIHANILLMAVWTDDQAKALPSAYDPLFLQEEPIELIPLLEDELLLELPLIPYHTSDCCTAGKIYSTESEDLSDQADTESAVTMDITNPFSILTALKTGAKTTIQES